MHEILRRELYRQHIPNDFYKTVEDFSECAINRAGLKKGRHLKLLPASVPLQLAMKSFGRLSKTTATNQFITVITDGYTKTYLKIPSKSNVPNAAMIIVDQWIV